MKNAIAFLLANAGPVIQYRLRREILHSLSASEEAALLTQIEQLPHMQLLQTYVKPNGYIGSGMHSWDNWRGQVLHGTPLQDSENAARLLSQYRIPKEHPLVSRFVSALRNEAILREEFSYIPPEKERFEKRFLGLNNANCLMALVYTVQALLGYGDDFEEVRQFQQIALKGFERILNASSFEEITRYDPASKKRYNYPFIEADDYFPNSLTLTLLAHTQSWRTPETIQMMADALNRLNAIMKPENNLHVQIGSRYIVPYAAMIRPVRAFRADLIDTILYRRVLTEIAMLGVGEKVEVIGETLKNISEATDQNGVLHMDFSAAHNRRYSPKSLNFPGPYSDVKLESSQSALALSCDLTFWAVELVHLTQKA